MWLVVGVGVGKPILAGESNSHTLTPLSSSCHFFSSTFHFSQRHFSYANPSIHYQAKVKRTMGNPTALFLSKPDPNLRCAICLDIFQNPVSLLSCSHTFCSECLSSSIASASKAPCCPECRAPIDEDDPAKGLHQVRVIESTINNLHVRCKNAYLDDECNAEDYCPNACGWTGPLSQWKLHAARECKVEIVQCQVCSHRCTRGQMEGHLGSRQCVEGAVEKRLAPLQMELNAQKRIAEKAKCTVKALTKERDELETRMKEESGQNKMLMEQNTWLRHSKEAQKKSSQNKISRLKREKKDLCLQITALEGRVKKEIFAREKAASGSKKRKRGGNDERVRAVSGGTELEVHAIC